MGTVGEITGQTAIVVELARALKSKNRTAVVSGAEGTGKTILALEVAKQLNDTHILVRRTGEKLLSTTPGAMLVGIGQRQGGFASGDTVVDIAQDFADLVEGGSVPFSRTLRRLIRFAGDRRKAKILSPHQQDFLHQLAKKKYEKSVLFIADDAHLWDDQSLEFLAQIHGGIWDATYPNLKNIRLLLVWTVDQAPSGFVDRLNVLFGKKILSKKLPRIRPDQYPLLLKAMGAPDNLPVNLVHELFAVTHGHLRFTAEIVELINTKNFPARLSKGKETDPQHLFREILERRVEAIGPMSTAIRQLLSALCVIGVNAEEHDIRCVLPEHGSSLQELVQRADESGLISVEASSIAIAHEIVRRVFLQFMAPDQQDFHARFARCLVKLRPSDYERRAVHLSAGGDEQGAEVARIMAVLASVRELRVSATTSWKALAAPISPENRELLDFLQRAAAEEHERKYETAIETLSECPVSGHIALLGERDYMLARLLLLVRTQASHKRALALVEETTELQNVEPDLWARLQELRLVLLSYLDRRNEARKLEIELRAFHSDRACYDIAAALAINRMRRKSESIHSPEVANDRLRRALSFLDPNGDGLAPRDLTEYALTLNNLGANEMVLGRFKTALSLFTRCLSFLERTEIEILRRREILLSNILVAGFLTGEAVDFDMETLQEIAEKIDPVASDGSLVRSNISSILIARGEEKTGYAILKAATDRIRNVHGFSAYSRYFAYSNQAVAEWLLMQRWEDSLSKADLASKNVEIGLRPYAMRRLDILISAMSRIDDKRSIERLDREFSANGNEIGPSWSLYGRAIALSDLQYWSES